MRILIKIHKLPRLGIAPHPVLRPVECDELHVRMRAKSFDDAHQRTVDSGGICDEPHVFSAQEPDLLFEEDVDAEFHGKILTGLPPEVNPLLRLIRCSGERQQAETSARLVRCSGERQQAETSTPLVRCSGERQQAETITHLVRCSGERQRAETSTRLRRDDRTPLRTPAPCNETTHAEPCPASGYMTSPPHALAPHSLAPHSLPPHSLPPPRRRHCLSS